MQEARTHFRDLFDSKQAVVIVSEEEWNRRVATRKSFGDLLAQCPLRADDLRPRLPARVMRRELRR